MFNFPVCFVFTYYDIWEYMEPWGSTLKNGGLSYSVHSVLIIPINKAVTGRDVRGAG
jgi:hypothetical protein